ncbi:MAG: hypothetical protein E6Q36_01210 [Chryseobacterium sp.]|nr:MAG: hypothetical protein E6Q36_01210 [Chryseobacterium sp.]
MSTKPYTIETIGRGKSRQIRITQGQHSWTGKTEKEAVAARDVDIQRFLEERFLEPILLRLPDGETAVASCGLSGWNYGKYKAQTSDNGEIECRYSGSVQYGRTRQQCERDMRCNAADQAIKIGRAESGFKVEFDGLTYFSSVNEVEDVYDHIVCIAFVRAFRQLEVREGSAQINLHTAACQASDAMRDRLAKMKFLSLSLKYALTTAVDIVSGINAAAAQEVKP